MKIKLEFQTGAPYYRDMKTTHYVVRERETGRYDVTAHYSDSHKVGYVVDGADSKEEALSSLHNSIAAYGWEPNPRIMFRSVKGVWS